MTTLNNTPAATSTLNTVAAITPVNTQNNPLVQEQNQVRLLAAAKGVSCIALGDAVQTKIINSARWVATQIDVISTLGATQTPTSSYIGVYTGASATGFTIATAGILTNVTLVQLVSLTANNTTGVTTDQNVYINVATATGNGAVDVLVWGYDLSA